MKLDEFDKLSKMPTPRLISEIQRRFHQNLLKNLTHVIKRLDLISQQEWKSNPNHIKIQELLTDFASKIPLHLLREEQIVFPLLIQTELDLSTCQSLPLDCMRLDHHQDLQMIKEIRILITSLQIHQQQEWIKYYFDLEHFLANLELHITIEDEILFPRFQQTKGLKIES